MNLTFKNIVVKCLVFTMSLLLTEACPDFTDNYKGNSTATTEVSFVEYLVDLITGNPSHDSHTSDHSASSQDHSIEIDAFEVVHHRLCTHFILFLTHLASIYHTPTSDVVIDVIPMPPPFRG